MIDLSKVPEGNACHALHAIIRERHSLFPFNIHCLHCRKKALRKKFREIRRESRRELRAEEAKSGENLPNSHRSTGIPPGIVPYSPTVAAPETAASSISLPICTKFLSVPLYPSSSKALVEGEKNMVGKKSGKALQREEGKSDRSTP